MRRILLFLFVPLFVFVSMDTMAAGMKDRMVKKRVVKNIIARKIIKRTALVILIAHKKVKENKVYTGNLARAINHQKYAKLLFARKLFDLASFHSLRARRLALLAIKANKGEEPKEAVMEKDETETLQGTPSDDDLDKELKKALPDSSEKDEDTLASSPDADLQ